MSFMARRTGRLAVVLAFFALCAGIFLWFLQGTATRVPILESKGYGVTVKIRDVDNIVPASAVRMAGVVIGEVRSVKVEPGGVLVDFAIDRQDVAPLHEGVIVRVGNKSLIGDSYLEVVDGKGAAYPEGATLPENVVELSTQLDDVVASLDPETKKALGSMLRSAGVGTADTADEVTLLAGGLGNLGRQGHTALDAVAAQSADLRALGRNTQVLMEALDGGQGQIATLVTAAQRVTNATAGQRESLENTLRALPGVLREAQTASGKVSELSGALAPVAAGLREASPELNTALTELRPTTEDLRGLLPGLEGTLDRAPATLGRVPTFDDDVQDLVPSAVDIMRDVNPMLRYLRPYGPELGAFFANFNSVLQYRDEAGIHYARLMVMVNEAAEQTPLKSENLAVYNNPLPKPGTGGRPGPFTGEYPRVERDN